MSTEMYVNKVLHWNRNGVPEGTDEADVYWKSLTAAQRNSASTYCGPHKSYPLGPGCNHVKSAFTLGETGHGQPNMSCIRNYARSHGCSMPTSQKSYNAIPDPANWQSGYSADRPKRQAGFEVPDVGRSTY